MAIREDDTWDRNCFDEDALFARMDVLGKGLCCDFGAGRQGVVYLTDDDSFVKVTRSSREAALARYLVDNPKAEFPAIQSVYQFEFEGSRLFAIYREDVEDVFGCDDDDSLMIETFTRSWTNLVLLWPPQHDAEAVRLLADRYPDLYGELYEFLGKMQDLKDFENLSVFDFHSDNIGRTKEGLVVVRDFGHHNLDDAIVDEMLGKIEELPLPQQMLAA